LSSIRHLYQRFRQLIHEGAKFGVVGGIGFLVTDGGTNLLQSPLHGWLKANVIATVAGMIVTYLGSRYWTFRHRERGGMGRETVLFVVLNAMGLGIQLACLGLTNYALGLTDKFSSNVALFLGICLGTLFRFWSYRKWVWVAPTAGPALDPAEFAAAELSHVPSAAAASGSAPGGSGYRQQAGLRRATQEQDATSDGLAASRWTSP
jgi:putative flippase GtrA